MYVYSHILCAPLHTLRCKDTTIFWNMQDFKQKNVVYACLSIIFCLKDCRSLTNANVSSAGTRLSGRAEGTAVFFTKNKRKAPT